MEDTRQKLIHAFLKLAKKQPINMIKVKHVTDLADYNRCTFYQYFDDIYDLLDQIEDQILSDIKIEIEKAYADSISYEEIVTIASASFEKYGEILTILMGSNGSPSFQKKYMNTLRPVISSIMKNKNLKFNDFIVEYAIGGFIATVNHWYHHQESMSLQEVTSLIYDLTTKGIFPC